MTNLEQSSASERREGVPEAVIQADHPAGPPTRGKSSGDGYHSREEEESEQPLTPPMSPIDEQVLEEVLYSRPTLRLGREVSLRNRARTAIPSRRRRVYQSLPHGAKRPKTSGTLPSGVLHSVCVSVCLCVCVSVCLCV